MKKLILIIATILLISMPHFISAADSAPAINTILLNQDPDPVQQGDVVELRFKIENSGIKTTEDVVVEILPKYPFSLYTGESIRKIGKLQSSQVGSDYVIVDYKLKVDESASQGDNEIELVLRVGTIEFSYTNNEFMVDIQKYSAPQLKAYIIQNTALQPMTKGIVTIELANIDISDVKFLQFTLLPSNDYQLVSSSNYIYMGDIDSDDTESEDFEIFVGDIKDGKVNIPIKLEYQDTNENNFEKQIDLSFNVYTSDELSKYGLKQTNYTLYVIIAIIILIIAYIFWKRRKNR
ncbi:MAG TPA: hypothetical protein VJ438_03720 [Candidatus Nanoarchaeia archaeon]|nr:hypothetical protein [Candidatus Nanoarchaeia archaeon]